MAWEDRAGNRYYYRSVREGGKVRKEYVGTGELAEALARADEAIRAARERKRAEAREALERIRELAAHEEEISEAAEVLVRAWLLAGGCHRRKGEWRIRRDA